MGNPRHMDYMLLTNAFLMGLRIGRNNKTDVLSFHLCFMFVSPAAANPSRTSFVDIIIFASLKLQVVLKIIGEKKK